MLSTRFAFRRISPVPLVLFNFNTEALAIPGFRWLHWLHWGKFHRRLHARLSQDLRVHSARPVEPASEAPYRDVVDSAGVSWIRAAERSKCERKVFSKPGSSMMIMSVSCARFPSFSQISFHQQKPATCGQRFAKMSASAASAHAAAGRALFPAVQPNSETRIGLDGSSAVSRA